jgi:hypothetical protein
MPFNDAYSNNILNFIFGKSSLTAPTTVYIGLCTNDPVADGGAFNELSGGNYGRVEIVKKVSGTDVHSFINNASGRAITNGKQINWLKATLDWELAKGFGLFTSETGGTPFFYGALELTEAQQAAGGLEVVTGAVALIDPQTLKISLPVTATAAASAE